jgi:DNA-binding response OmpR family regulator
MPSHILIVDDETNIRLMLGTALRSEGYVVDEAVDGRAALDYLEKKTPDVMLLDLSMPAVDGLGVLQGIQAMRPGRKPRVIVLSAYGSIPAAVKATRLGAIDFLEKPVVPDEIREAVAVALEEPLPAVTKGPDPLSGGYDAVLYRARQALRMANYTDAESLIMKAADLAHRDAPYFNLLGALYETQREFRMAKRFYTRALKINARYEPAAKNLRRLGDIKRTGQADSAPILGDEMDVLYARLPVREEPKRKSWWFVPG